MFDLELIKSQLAKVNYDPALGIRIVHLTKTKIGDIDTELIIAQMDKGKGLRPHVHEKNGEVGFPLTSGFVKFGTPVKDDSGEYAYEGDEVKVEWDEEIALTAGKSFEVPAGKAHVFYASNFEEFLICFFLPSDHLGPDRKFVVPPQA